jgi:hypothetical protein
MKNIKTNLCQLLIIDLLVFTSISFQSCKTNDNDLNETINLPDGWVNEDLNGSYTIAFPETYTGSGLFSTEEGYCFSKRREDDKVIFSMFGEIICTGWGETFHEPLPDTTLRYDTYQDVFREGELLGRFYYTEDIGTSFRQSEGRYFIKISNNDFTSVIGTSYSQDTYSEVIQILENIRKK